MSRKKNNSKREPMMFSFGDPEPVLNNSITQALGCFYSDWQKYYEPPISFSGLDKMTHANPYHSTSIFFKRNQMVKLFKPNSLLRLTDFHRLALDYLTFGNAFALAVKNYLGHIIRLKHIPALNIRRGKDNIYYQIKQGSYEPVPFKRGEVLHVMTYSTGQSLYGVPEWYSGLHSALLNSEATLFRRRYYKNGAHLGYILFTSSPDITPEIEKMITEQVSKGKGVGNFKSMYINLPNANEKALQVIPVGDINQKDEFEKIKNISADDVIVAHRVPPALAGVKPTNTGGFGDIEKIDSVYQKNEVIPLTLPFLELNDQLHSSQRIEFNKPNGTL